MTGLPKIEIIESVENLKDLMKQQKTGLGYGKIQAIYLLKIKAVETVRHLAVIVGRGEATVHRWLHLERVGGLAALLKEKTSTGRPKKVTVEEVAKLQQELKEPEGFSSYQEVKIWSWAIRGIQLSYATIHRIVRYELQAKLKIPRPKSNQQEVGAVEKFVEQRPNWLNFLKEWIISEYGQIQNICYWCQDETRLGLKTMMGKKLTLKGIKPIGQIQWEFNYYYIYGLVEPKSGRAFFYEFTHLTTLCFQKYLEIFSQQFPNEIHIVQLDNAPFHRAKQLKIPENIILIFQPPYCPEVNPIERFWQYLKSYLK